MSTEPSQPTLKPLRWVGPARKELVGFPVKVRQEAGYALYLAQLGLKSPKAKALRGFGGAGVLEVVSDFDGNAYRAVYTVNFLDIVYVLHAFQKKSKKGIATPKSEIDLIKKRLKIAAEDYRGTIEREDS